jgi:2-hydroxy-3-keto-5-methylthiopentenyl-1-phosphate phosphatase
MLDDLQAIIQNKAYVTIIRSTKRWLMSLLETIEISTAEECNKLVQKHIKIDEFLQEIRSFGGDVRLVYWDPALSKKFEI